MHCFRMMGFAVALSCAACATTAVTTPAPSAGGGSGTATNAAPLLTGTASINGAYEATGTFSAHPEVLVGSQLQPPSAHDTCADYAQGFAQNPTSFAVLALQTNGTPNTLYLTTTIASGYHGPGTYTSQSTPMLRGQVAVGVGALGDLNGAGYIDTFRSGFPGTTTLTVEADGSGTLAFSSWGSDGTILSGSVSWLCD
jgi:hypothetical protein